MTLRDDVIEGPPHPKLNGYQQGTLGDACSAKGLGMYKRPKSCGGAASGGGWLKNKLTEYPRLLRLNSNLNQIANVCEHHAGGRLPLFRNASRSAPVARTLCPSGSRVEGWSVATESPTKLPYTARLISCQVLPRLLSKLIVSPPGAKHRTA